MKKESQSQNKGEMHADYNATSHVRDVNGHEIFKNNRLTSQFLSNYTGIQMLSGVKPEDIGDVSERNHATNEELSEKGDEMAPEEIKQVIVKVLWALLKKMNVPNEEARELMGEIGGQGMGILFENAEKMDIQAERRNTQREKERADAEKERADAAEERADAEKERADAEKERADLAEKQLEKMCRELDRLKGQK